MIIETNFNHRIPKKKKTELKTIKCSVTEQHTQQFSLFNNSNY